MMSGSPKHYVLPLTFALLIAVHVADHFFGFIPEPELAEKRVKVQKPRVKVTHLDVFPRQYEAYYNDHFNWRDLLIRIGSRFRYFALQTSPQPDKVIIGKEGWMYKSGVARDLFIGHIHYNQRRINRFLEEFHRRRQIIEDLGGTYYIAFAPLKHDIYPEYLPDELTRNKPPSSTQHLREVLMQDSLLQFIDLTTPLIAAKASARGLIFHKTDHHWSEEGALIAAQEIISAIRQKFPEVDPIDTTKWQLTFEETPGWSLAGLIGIEQDVTEVVPRYIRRVPRVAHDTMSYHLPPDEFWEDYIVAKKTARKDKPSLFVVRDSFGSPVIKFLSDEFSYSFYLWDKWEHALNADIFAKEGCDIYVQLIWEGLLLRLIETPPRGWFF
ncbi:MAG: hypothetical protein R3301_15025 [Saprospiraceae bacterium]|nr:hypothetical protein [Saprospiraceae bacterium]